MNPSNTSNSERLRAVVQFFGLTLSQVARTCNVSVPYISRVLASNGSHISGSSGFWLAAEKALGQLVQERRAQVFEVTPVDVSTAEALRKLV